MAGAQQPTDEALALVCNLPVDSQARRRVDLFSVLQSALSAKPLVDGVEIAFPSADDTASAAFAFVLAERNCCPQFDYQIEFKPNHGPVQLRVRAHPSMVKPLRDLYMGLAAEAGVAILDGEPHR